MGGTTQRGPQRPVVYAVPTGVLGAVVVVLLGLIVLLGFPDPHPPPPAAVAAPAPPAEPSLAIPSPVPTAATVPTPPTGELVDLRATAARFTAPVRLASPASWDRWLPAGKPYPGASTAEDMATCPHLADRLTAALGRRTSYRTGTLPAGPGGCTWATVPLSSDGPSAYLLSVGYLADGTTTADWRARFSEHRGAVCPATDVPAVAPGAVLVRCEDDAGRPGLTLVLPDTRRPGLWFLGAVGQAPAPRTSADALAALVAAVRGVYR